jgi:hypothetical protein
MSVSPPIPDIFSVQAALFDSHWIKRKVDLSASGCLRDKRTCQTSLALSSHVMETIVPQKEQERCIIEGNIARFEVEACD